MIHLLVVDDNEINNFLLKHMIKKSGLDIFVTFYTNPESVISYIKTSLSESHAIDFIFLDINMPLMSGWELLDELKRSGMKLLNYIPVYIFSSSVHQKDQEIAKNYPEVCGFLLKPVCIEILQELVEQTAAIKPQLS